jgi:hypothetical protein
VYAIEIDVPFDIPLNDDIEVASISDSAPLHCLLVIIAFAVYGVAKKRIAACVFIFLYFIGTKRTANGGLDEESELIETGRKRSAPAIMTAGSARCASPDACCGMDLPLKNGKARPAKIAPIIVILFPD